MGRAVHLSLIADLEAVLQRELGAGRAREVLRDVGLRVSSSPPSPDQSKCGGSGSYSYAVWSAAVLALAREKPELFGPRLRKLGPNPWPVALAYLYVSEQHPDELTAFEPTEREREVLAITYESLKALPAARDLGWPSFAGSGWVCEVSARCSLLAAWMRWQDFGGASLGPHSSTRQVVLLRDDSVQRLRALGGDTLASVLIHELVHGALAAMARQEGLAPYAGRLSGLVDEAVTDALALAALFILPEGGRDMDTFRSEVGHAGPAVSGLLRVLEATDRLDINGRMGSLIPLGVANLRADGDEAATVAVLNRAAGTDWTARDWLAQLGVATATP